MPQQLKILVLNGPNLNLLGKREPEVYGHKTLVEIMQDLHIAAVLENVELTHLQSNREYEIVEKIHEAMGIIDYIIINPAAFTHTSVAIRDALLGVNIPFIEVHLSNVHSREEFRQHSFFSDIAVGTIVGLGAQGYELGLQAAIRHLKT